MKSIIVALLLAACSPMSYTHGVPNLAQVDSNVWRSGQITTQEGWDYIAKLANGRRVHVIKLNYIHEGSDGIALDRGYEVFEFAIQPEGDRDWWDDLKNAFRQPDAATVALIDKTLDDAPLQPNDFYLVHCTHGQDRTGYVIGRYRVRHNGYTKERAYKEMLDHNFHPELHGVHEAWEQYKP